MTNEWVMNRNNFMTQYIYHIKQLAGTASCRLRHCLTMLILLMGTAGTWAQHPYAGVWYMKVKKNLNYYMVPAADPQVTAANHVNEDAYFSSNYSTQDGDPEKPFITTYQTSGDLNSIWIFVPVSDESNYYYILHALTGKYVKYQTYLTGDNARRKYVHLEAVDSPGETEKFEITELNDGVKIKPKNNSMYFNVAGDNQSRYNGGTSSPYYSGIVGGMNGTDTNSQFNLTDASSATSLTPVISNVDIGTNAFTITSPAAAYSTIRYTTDGSTTPDANAGTAIASGSSITITSNWAVQAVGVFGSHITPVATKNLVPAPCAPPVISYNYTTRQVSITCSTPNSTIYYTTNGNDPTTLSTEYSVPFSLSDPTTVKAFATHPTKVASAVTELAVSQVATPTIQNNGSNAISITTATLGATIYYTTDGSTPNTSSTVYSNPLTDNISNVNIKAIAIKENMITSAVGSGQVKLQCAAPIISRVGMTFTLSSGLPTNANLYYRLGLGPEKAFTGTPIAFTLDQLPITVTAVARHSDYTDSEEATMVLKNGSGTPADPYLIYGVTDFTNFVTNVNSGTTASASYKLGSDVSVSGTNPITTEFTGSFDGGGYTISGLSHALFNTVNGGVIKNVILDNVSISEGTNVGAICNDSTGASRIYNCGVLATGSTIKTHKDGYTVITTCSSTISGSGYVGSIVGLLDGSSRVINCFSYANVSGGSYVGGIVGYNNVATTASNLQTMVMNCMFYGEVSGSSIAPIYNGKSISNVGNTGVGNYNYFRLESSYIQNTGITKVYNCALGAEDRYLQRFEFFRNLLNSHRELAGWWATGTYSSSEMMKWVLEPSQIGTSTPYPILKAPGKYPSVVNIDAAHAVNGKPRNQGGKLGTLTVNIQMGNGAVYNAPTDAEITTTSLTLNITDKDTAHFNFNYYKVQLPYYNDVGTKNYNGNRVVTGWKIVSIKGGTPGTFTASDTWGGYNFADRNCTNKDLYGTGGSNRIFNQGAYWDVPEGVTEITIEPYWAKCVYLADQNADKVYNAAMETGYDVSNVGGGQIYTNGNSYSIAGESQVVYTTMGNAIASSGTALFQGVDANSHSVYDYAVVLVGNYHHYYANSSIEASKSKPYTITSIDLDGDNEPDYSYILRFNGRTECHPVRTDFINIPGLGMAQKSTGGKGSYNFGILIPKGWFESTNTSLLRFTQFEYENSARSETDALILQGGVMEQWVSYNQKGRSNKIPYIHVGGNVWFKEFHTGCHQDKNQTSGNNRFQPTKHSPISVTGGDFDEFYLTGLYVANAGLDNYADNAECYINGGRFGTVCGAAMEGIGKADGTDNTGNISWLIQNADIREFYAGGLNATKPVTGNLTTTIIDSHVDIFCGGPKFGDMSANKTIVTNATGSTFGTFFGAGYGGNSYYRYAPTNQNSVTNINWNNWVSGQYTRTYNATYGGVSTQFDYQFLPMSDNKTNVARIFVEFVSFSLATTRNITSSLTGCTITGSFYGGGSLGKVDGDVTSTLTNCTVKGNVFGAGYSASLPTVKVMDVGFQTEPYYYEDLGTYRTGVFPATTPYKWEHNDSPGVDNNILKTTADISKSNLGSVDGNVTLNIQGNSFIGTDGDTTGKTGNVYGGGDESYVIGAANTVTVNISGNTEILGNVFGGGNRGLVNGSTTVNIED